MMEKSILGEVPDLTVDEMVSFVSYLDRKNFRQN